MEWNIKPKPDIHKIKHLSSVLGVCPTIATLLVLRGIETFDTAKQFFRPSLSDLHNPFLMKDMKEAVLRIQKAIQDQERILVYGDYDVDGTTAVALLYTYLRNLSPLITTYIPDRYAEGYGVSYQSIDFAATNGINLIITLDCGIKATDKVRYASQKGIDFIICDHHRPGSEIPNAVAVLDPKRNDCPYPYKELCGCGVGFKLIQALSILSNQPIAHLVPYLDLVATAIAADIVPITGENRILAYHGLEVINTSPRTGFKAMLAQVKKEELTISDVVFVLAPRINAAGRMKHGSHAVSLLSEDNFEKALAVAKTIENYNLERKAIDSQITNEALAQIIENDQEQNYTTVVYGPKWHKGVIGIVASRLIEQYYRPTLVFTKTGNKLAASARSVQGFDIYQAIENCQEFIDQFGGHKYAAGLTLKESNFKYFAAKFEQTVKETITKSSLAPEILIDSKIDINQLTPKFYRILKQFAPFGPQNRSPIFKIEAVRDTGYSRCVGADGLHLKCRVTKNNQSIDAIGFNLGQKHHFITDKKTFDIACSVEENEWNGETKLQLKLRDISPL